MKIILISFLLLIATQVNAATITIILTDDKGVSTEKSLEVSSIDIDILLTDMKDIPLWGIMAYDGKIHHIKSTIAKKAGKGGENSTSEWLDTVVESLKIESSDLLKTAEQKELDKQSISK